jgi:hypothetical protein
MFKRISFMLEKIANVAVIIVSIVVVFIVARDWKRPSGPQQQAVGSWTYIGKSIVLPADSDSAKVQTAVVLGLSMQCQFCTRGIPFYRRLQSARDASHGRLKMYAYFREAKDDVGKEVSAWGLAPDATMAGTPRGVSINSTPTVLITDAKGVVRKAWIGLLDTKGEDDLLTELMHRCGNCFALTDINKDMKND